MRQAQISFSACTGEAHALIRRELVRGALPLVAAFTYDGAFALKGAAYKEDFGPIEADCDCFTCTHHTRAYVRHLLNVDEILGLRLLTLHNLRLYLRLMSDMRKHIEAGTFGEFRLEFAARYTPTTRVAAQRKNA